MLASEWQTEVLPVSDSMKAPFMSCIRLPIEFQTTYGTSHGAQASIRECLQKNYNIVVAITSIQSSLWCRVSANVYNSKEDYVKVGNAVKRMKKDIVSGVLLPDVSVIGGSLGPSPAHSMNLLYH